MALELTKHFMFQETDLAFYVSLDWRHTDILSFSYNLFQHNLQLVSHVAYTPATGDEQVEMGV